MSSFNVLYFSSNSFFASFAQVTRSSFFALITSTPLDVISFVPSIIVFAVFSIPSLPFLNTFLNLSFMFCNKPSFIDNSDKNSFFINQINLNNLNVIYIEETSLFESLKTINSKFTLIIKEKDAVILKDLTDNFLNDFLNLDQDFVFAGMSFPVPVGNIENYNLLFFTGLYKYINSSLIFGFTDKIRNFIYKFNIDN